MERREFGVAGEYRTDRRSTVRWVVSHAFRYPWIPISALLLTVLVGVLSSTQSVLVGQAFDLALAPGATVAVVGGAAVTLLLVGIGRGVAQLLRNLASEWLAQRVEQNTRDELYLSLLGKSLTFHGRQRIGDIMARATNDVRQLNFMINPGFHLILSSFVGLAVPMIVIPLWLRADLLLAPAGFVALFAWSLRRYSRELDPVVGLVRERFGALNARLAETIAGIEVVKGSAQEEQEKTTFHSNAAGFREAFVRQGDVEARYLPLLVFSLLMGGGFLHALLLMRSGAMTVGEVVIYMGLLSQFSFPTFISIYSFATMQLGLASARRILDLIRAETELDENPGGVTHPIAGQIRFENVSFSYGDSPLLSDVSFTANPGETIAIVGQTGSGKSTLTRLVNRTYDVTGGRVLVDGIDVREWNLASLRSQISAIEQDVFLFSRSLAENIRFGAQGDIGMEAIQRAAAEAQAHDFILSFPNGYGTEIGERGVTLSGGQRQRIAIARAFLTNPRILILDDSTSAIDSATEDHIQQAMRRIMQGRTTLLITHRLSQIRWADRILVLRRGSLVDQGTHDELLGRCDAYRRIFRMVEPNRPALAAPAPSLPTG